jgi:hypothetical protein
MIAADGWRFSEAERFAAGRRMTDHGIDGRAIGRQQLLQLVRDACANASALCEDAAISPNEWQHRATSTIKSCGMLQRGLVNSHPQLADELHILSTEIQIALAAQSDQALFAERIQRVRDSILRLQQSKIGNDRGEAPGAPSP